MRAIFLSIELKPWKTNWPYVLVILHGGNPFDNPKMKKKNNQPERHAKIHIVFPPLCRNKRIKFVYILCKVIRIGVKKKRKEMCNSSHVYRRKSCQSGKKQLFIAYSKSLLSCRKLQLCANGSVFSCFAFSGRKEKIKHWTNHRTHTQVKKRQRKMKKKKRISRSLSVVCLAFICIVDKGMAV